MKKAWTIGLGILIGFILIMIVQALFFGGLLFGFSKFVSSNVQEAQEELKDKERARVIAKYKAINSKKQGKEEKRAKEITLQRESMRKNKKWEEWYETPENCLNPPSMPEFVECADQKKKARETFDMLYKSGHFN